MVDCGGSCHKKTMEYHLNFQNSKPPNPVTVLHELVSSLVSRIANPRVLKADVCSCIQDLQHQANMSFRSAVSLIVSRNKSSRVLLPARHPHWASTASSKFCNLTSDGPMPTETIEERLAGVPVYALSNIRGEFVVVSGTEHRKGLGLLCFRKEDAEVLLEQTKAMHPPMQTGSNVVPVALSKIFQLRIGGVAFRFIPDSSEVANAVKIKEKEGSYDGGYPGVPVFRSQRLFLSSPNKRYRPFFFRKDDLERSLLRASNQDGLLDSALLQSDVQVDVLEEIIKEMKGNLAWKWHDVVFVPPGFDYPTDATH